MADRGGLFAPLERRSAALFFLAGGLMVVVVALFATGREPGSGDPLLGVAPAGFAAAFLGLLGLYPTLGDRSPRLARAGAIFLGIGVAGALIVVVGNAGELAGLYAEAPVWVDAANLLLIFGGVTLGFGIFGVGVLRTDTYSRTVGLLLLWPAVVFGVGLIVVGTFILGVTFPLWIHMAHSASEAVVYLSLGYLLRRTQRS